MKLLLFLFIAHLAVCAAGGYFFHERSESHDDSGPPLETTTVEERRGEASFIIQSHFHYRFPGALNLYFIGGLLALVAAFVIELYQRLFPH